MRWTVLSEPMPQFFGDERKDGMLQSQNALKTLKRLRQSLVNPIPV